MARKKAKGTELSVFKGREAKLNRAIFHTLAIKGPQTAYDVFKQLTGHKLFRKVRYSTVNKRVRDLEKAGYLRVESTKMSKAGFQSQAYETTVKAYLAIMLNSLIIDDFLSQLNDDDAQIVLASITNAHEKRLSSDYINGPESDFFC